MAPAVLTPGRASRRENQFFDVGVQGRKTGITLRDTGIRDENGMMPLDGIFSSPTKSPEKPTFDERNGDTVREPSESMQLGSVPQAAEVPSAGRLMRSGKKLLPPPMGRSPIKTSLGSSPQRLSIAASSARKAAMTPSGSLRKPPVRKLDFNQDEPIASIERSPTRMANLGRYGPDSSPLATGKRKAGMVEAQLALPSSPIIQNEHHDADDYILPQYGDDDSIHMLHRTGETFIQAGPSANLTPGSRKQGATNNSANMPSDPFKNGAPSSTWSKRKRASDDEVIDPSLLHMENAVGMVEESHHEATPEQPDTGPLPIADSDPPERYTTDFSDEEEYAPSPEKARTKSNAGGNMSTKANGRLRIYADDYTEVGAEASHVMLPPSKRTKTSGKPKERDPNVPMSRGTSKGGSAKPSFPPPVQAHASRSPPVRARTGSAPRATSRGASAAPSNAGGRNRSRAPRTLQILRQGTPAEDDGALRTRSGRTSIQPVHWWCGERVDRAHDGSIKGVTRVEELELEGKSKTKSKGKKKSRAQTKRSRPLEEIQEEEEEVAEEEEVEEWEAEGRVLTGRVRSWEAAMNPDIEQEDVEMEIAYGRNSIELKDVAGADFQYGKCIALPFFGAGLVDIPPGGYKRAKNSRRMQMVFFVHEGKVTVSVGDQGCIFAISKGGLWSVPRGNNYSINNDGATPARIFFAQGCEMIPDE